MSIIEQALRAARVHLANGGNGDIQSQIPNIDNPISVFPKPQRMFPEDARPAGGQYLNAATKEDVTGRKASMASIGVGPDGKPYFKTSPDDVDQTGSPGKGSAITKTNLFKQKAGWRWSKAPEGFENVPTIVSVEHRGNHHYALNAHFPKGVDLARYENAPSEPRLRPTTKGNVHFGDQVGSILVRGREHPVYDHVIVKSEGGLVDRALHVARAQGGKIDPALIGHHNTTAKGVDVASELGGIPMPSMAISNVHHPLTNFGDVSLIASPEMIKPSAHTKVYGADVYTGRQPRGEEEFRDPKAVAQVMGRDPHFGHMSDFPRMMGAHDSLESADRMMRRAQAMAALGADPKKFQRFDQFVRADHPGVDYAAPYKIADEMSGIRQYGETVRTLPPADRFTASGNRRKNIPYTMENVLKHMRGERAWEPQQEGFDYGSASFRAGVTPALKTINEIQKQRGKIIHPDEMEAVKSEYAKTYDSMIDAMKQFAKSKDKSGFRTYVDAQEALNDIAKGKSVSWYGDIPEEMRSKIGEFVKHTKSLPTEYFEAKTKRAVPLGEFSGAIVPRGSDNTINKLDKEGIKKILQYGSPEERVAMFKQFPEAMFAHGGLVLNNDKDGKRIVDYTLQKFGPATARDAVKSAKAVRGRPVKE